MSPCGFSTGRGLWRWLAVALICSVTVAWGGDLKVNARLIWGTNDGKSPDPAHRPVDDDLAKKLGKTFKWKNYFEVRRVTAQIPNHGVKRITMSPKCDLEVTDLGGSKIAVKLFGEGKPVNRSVGPLAKGELFIIGGDDKGDNSWCIVLAMADGKTTAPKTGGVKTAPGVVSNNTNPAAQTGGR